MLPSTYPLSSTFSFCLYPLFSNASSSTHIYTLSLHDALPISTFGSTDLRIGIVAVNTLLSASTGFVMAMVLTDAKYRSEEHTSELQSLRHLVCRLLLEKKKKIDTVTT